MAQIRIASTLACLFLLLLPASAAPGGVATYLSTRDRYIAQFRAHPAADDGSDNREGHALDDLERRIKAIIPPWHAPGFATESRISLSVLHQDLGFGMLDGLAYGARATEVIVTTPVLLQRWITDHNKPESPSREIPQAADAAVRSSQFWTHAFGDDNGWLFFGDVPVDVSSGKATAQLATDTDSGFPDTGPTYLLVTVMQADRVFVARQKLAINVPRQPVCEGLLRAGNKTDEQLAQDFQVCFAPYLHEQSQQDAIQKQAQALVDLLH